MYSIFAIYLHTYLAVFVLVISVSWIQHSRRGCYGNMYMSQFFFIRISVHRIWILLLRCQLSFRPPLSMLSRAVQFPSTVWPMLQVNGDPIRQTIASLHITQTVLPSVSVNGDQHLWTAVWHCQQKNGSRVSGKATLSPGNARPSSSFLWQPALPSDDTEGDSSRAFRIQVHGYSALFLCTVETIKCTMCQYMIVMKFPLLGAWIMSEVSPELLL